MPIFTVTVQGPNGQTKTVTVNTDNMEAEVVPNEPVNASNPFLKNEASAVSNMVEPSENPFLQTPSVEKPVAPAVNNRTGGKRSTRLFRSKKKRTTRKLRQ